MEDVQSYMEDAALTEARAELLKVKFQLQEEQNRNSELEGTLAAQKKQIAALEKQQGQVRTMHSSCNHAALPDVALSACLVSS